MEIVQELVWRGFPIYRKSTVFSAFWEAYDDGYADIKDINQWGALGKNARGQIDENIIFAMRSDLLRRFPHTIPFLLEHDPSMSKDELFDAFMKGVDDAKAKAYAPMFCAELFSDLSLQYYEVTAEHMRAARSGEKPGGVKTFSLLLMEDFTIPKFGLAATKHADVPAWSDYGVVAPSDYLNISAGVFQSSAAAADVLLTKPCAVILDFSNVFDAMQQ
jgi:hypothetical protein